jgi:chorismate-pyruvate lyase
MSQLAEVPLRPLQIVATRTDAPAEALLRRHFHAQDARPTSWQDVSLTSLAPHHRTLMMTDGTVTRMLEAYTFESVEAKCVEQYETTAAHDRGGWLRAAAEDRMLVRHVDLIGVRSGICYAQAESRIAVDRLPNTFHTALASEPAGIGAALRAASAESYRQLLFYGRTFDCLFARCYRVFVRKCPALVITERFLR